MVDKLFGGMYMDLSYYNTKAQLKAATPIIALLAQNLVEENTFGLKKILMAWIDEIELDQKSAISLNELILAISNYLVKNQIRLTKENAILLKKLFELVCAPI